MSRFIKENHLAIIGGLVAFSITAVVLALSVASYSDGQEAALDYKKAMETCSSSGDTNGCMKYWLSRAERAGTPVEPLPVPTISVEDY